jgi:uncharacterized RDD family membrane protein YckC
MQTVRVRTTQNVFIEYGLASIGDRILAYLIDRVILAIYIITVIAVLVQTEIQGNDDITIWIAIILVAFPLLFYSLLFEIAMNGQTPGKRVMKIQVVKLDGTPATIGNYLLRWIFGPVDFLFMSGVVAVVCIAMGGKGQRVGDMVADTTVVKANSQHEISGNEIFIVPEKTHTPTFAQVTELNDRDIELIQRALDVMREQGNAEPALAITGKIKSRLGIQSDLNTTDFLTTIVKDYGILMSGRV